jgi:hypothetical protein
VDDKALRRTPTWAKPARWLPTAIDLAAIGWHLLGTQLTAATDDTASGQRTTKERPPTTGQRQETIGGHRRPADLEAAFGRHRPCITTPATAYVAPWPTTHGQIQSMPRLGVSLRAANAHRGNDHCRLGHVHWSDRAGSGCAGATRSTRSRQPTRYMGGLIYSAADPRRGQRRSGHRGAWAAAAHQLLRLPLGRGGRPRGSPRTSPRVAADLSLGWRRPAPLVAAAISLGRGGCTPGHCGRRPPDSVATAHRHYRRQSPSLIAASVTAKAALAGCRDSARRSDRSLGNHRGRHACCTDWSRRRSRPPIARPPRSAAPAVASIISCPWRGFYARLSSGRRRDTRPRSAWRSSPQFLRA